MTLGDHWESMTSSITQQDLERLLKESEQIATDWNAYLQFQQNRNTLFREFMPNEGVN